VSERIRAAAEEFALGMLGMLLDVVKAMDDVELNVMLAETTRRRDVLVAGVIATYGEDDSRAILAEGGRIAEELHGIAKAYFEETRSVAAGVAVEPEANDGN